MIGRVLLKLVQRVGNIWSIHEWSASIDIIITILSTLFIQFCKVISSKKNLLAFSVSQLTVIVQGTWRTNTLIFLKCAVNQQMGNELQISKEHFFFSLCLKKEFELYGTWQLTKTTAMKHPFNYQRCIIIINNEASSFLWPLLKGPFERKGHWLKNLRNPWNILGQWPNSFLTHPTLIWIIMHLHERIREG